MRLGAVLWLAAPLRAQERVVPRAGLVITHSVRLTPGTWHLDPFGFPETLESSPSGEMASPSTPAA